MVANLSNRWLDKNVTDLGGTGSSGRIAIRSVLELELERFAWVSSYELFTARDNPWRDPTGWSFGVVVADGADGGRPRWARRVIVDQQYGDADLNNMDID